MHAKEVLHLKEYTIIIYGEGCRQGYTIILLLGGVLTGVDHYTLWEGVQTGVHHYSFMGRGVERGTPLVFHG